MVHVPAGQGHVTRPRIAVTVGTPDQEELGVEGALPKNGSHSSPARRLAREASMWTPCELAANRVESNVYRHQASGSAIERPGQLVLPSRA
jgi:hypothetical protein